MHTVVETPAYLADAKAARLTEAERDAIVRVVATNPLVGDEIPGTGGARKLRVGSRGKGKSGGFRVISFFSGENLPVFLLALYSKSEKANLSSAERKELKNILGDIVEAYRKRRANHV